MSPATPPLVGRRVKNVLEIDFERLYSISGATTETEHLAFVPTEPFLTQLVQSCTQHQLVTTVTRSVLYPRTLAPRSEKQK